ncbi:retrovirus-related pol polyprotein from transposon TNT 1-94 [Tanacetum coccineum]
MFPMMYSLESAKTISVAAKLASLNLCSSFHRTLRGGVEQQQFFDLMAFLEGTDLPNMMDRWTWSLSSSFKLDNLPTRLNLSRRGVDLESIFCPICNLAVESSDHILFQCSLMKEIYFKIANCTNAVLARSQGTSVKRSALWRDVKTRVIMKASHTSAANNNTVAQGPSSPHGERSERPRFSKQRFASQIDVNNDLSKAVTTHYLPKERESAIAKPYHMIAPGSSTYSSNDMVHNHYLKEAKKNTQESCRNSEPSVMPSARSQSTTNGSKLKPMINNQKSRNWPASKSSCVTTKTKCVFNANHDSCVTKFLNEVNSRAKVPSHKTTTRYKPVEQTSVAKKPERQIPKRHRSSIKKTSVVHEKTMTPRSCLRWKPTGKIFKTVGLKWIPTGKILTSSTTKVDSEPTNGSNDDITNQYECKQTLDVSAGLAPPRQMTSDHNSSELGIHDHSNELSSSKLVPKVVPPADKTATSRQELELLFHHHITMLRSTINVRWEIVKRGAFQDDAESMSCCGQTQFARRKDDQKERFKDSRKHKDEVERQ